MDRDAATEHCLSLPGAYLDSPWSPDHLVAKVGGKIFAFLGDPGPAFTITAKNTPEVIDEWRARFPEHAGLARYLSKTLWNQVVAAGLGAPDDDEVRELIDDSYALIVAALPRAKRP